MDTYVYYYYKPSNLDNYYNHRGNYYKPSNLDHYYYNHISNYYKPSTI